MGLGKCLISGLRVGDILRLVECYLRGTALLMSRRLILHSRIHLLAVLVLSIALLLIGTRILVYIV